MKYASLINWAFLNPGELPHEKIRLARGEIGIKPLRENNLVELYFIPNRCQIKQAWLLLLSKGAGPSKSDSKHVEKVAKIKPKIGNESLLIVISLRDTLTAKK